MCVCVWGKGGGESESLRILFLEAVCDFRRVWMG